MNKNDKGRRFRLTRTDSPTGAEGDSLQDLGLSGFVNLYLGSSTVGVESVDGYQNCTMPCQNSTDLFRLFYTIANYVTLVCSDIAHRRV